MATRESIPLLYVRANSNYDVGYSIGRTFKLFLEKYCASETVQTLITFYNSAKGKEVYGNALASAEKCFPHIVEEIRGLADGSGIPFETLFLHSMIVEILLFYSQEAETITKVKTPGTDDERGCTDVLINTERLRVLAHNEDWLTVADDLTFLVDVDLVKSKEKLTEEHTAKNTTERFLKELAQRDERYISYLFPGSLAGVAFYVNRNFAASLNSLVPDRCNKDGVPVDILLRALIGCETIEECTTVMENNPVGCTYGININIASRKTNEMWSLEVYPNQGKTIVDLHQIPFVTSKENGRHYVHTNHYKHLVDACELPRLRGSQAREDVASKMPIPKEIQDVCNILGDTSSDVEPIYRTPGSGFYSKASRTVATAAFDMINERLHIYLHNPKSVQKPSVTLPFLE